MRERARERHRHHLDHLVGLVALRHRLEVEGGEEVDHLVGEARRGPGSSPSGSRRPARRPASSSSSRARAHARARRRRACRPAPPRSCRRPRGGYWRISSTYVVALEGHHRGGARVAHDVELDAPARSGSSTSLDLDHDRAAAVQRRASRRALRLRARAPGEPGKGHSRRSGQPSHCGRRASQQTRPWWITRCE